MGLRMRSTVILLSGAGISLFAAKLSGRPLRGHVLFWAFRVAGEPGDRYAAPRRLLTTQRNLSATRDTTAKGASARHVQTFTTRSLARRMKTGLLVRDPDDYSTMLYRPASFWRSDIHVPNQMFIWWERSQGLIWKSVRFGYVADPEFLKWTPDTLYHHDANACDGPAWRKGRCTYLPESQAWDCPHARANGSSPRYFDFHVDKKKLGAGSHKCQGCHWRSPNLITNPSTSNCKCACKNELSCKALATSLQARYGEQAGSDKHICWTNTLNHLVAMQNALWDGWHLKGRVSSHRSYWGWNEVAVHKSTDDPRNWTALLIYITAGLNYEGGGLCGLECFDTKLMRDLDARIDRSVTSARPAIRVGWAGVGQHPGSDVVIARQRLVSGKYLSEFFCQHYTPTFKSAMYKMCARAMTRNGTGHCYIERVGNVCK
mmetsp:Transcript_78310/g.239528  ORF Transcript_78310/g.239528 Transcript_78310/m.239528 type:complete len:431 (-) Transcript_78310:220-1512(-)